MSRSQSSANGGDHPAQIQAPVAQHPAVAAFSRRSESLQYVRSPSIWSDFPRRSVLSPSLSASSLKTTGTNVRASLLRRSSSFGGAPIVVVKTLDGDDGWVEGSGEPCARGPPPWLRWVVLFLSCLLLYGNYYAYDLPAALNIPLQEYLQHDYDQYQFELNLLYTVYSVPNIVLPFVGGHLVDTLDPRLVLLGFSAFVCLGQTIFAIGVVTKNFGVMLVGRGVFGIGGECISVVQAAITTQWFRGKEVAFALGLNLCIARLGSVSNTILSPRIASRFSVPAAIWAGSLTCYLSLCASLTLASVMTMYTYNMRGKAPANNAEVQSPSSSEVSSPQPSFDPNDPASQVEEPSSAESTPLLFKQHTPKQHSCPLLFPASFYLICVICVLLYGTVIPFNNIASDFLTSKYFPGDVAHANLMMSIPDTLSAFLVPPCGYLLDRYGRRVTALLASALAITLVHLTLGLTTTIHPAYPLILLGFAYSFYGCAIWPSVAIAVAHSAEHVESIGTAYGVSTSALNAALSVFPMIAAGVLVRTGGFVGVEMFFAGLAGAGAVVSFVLWEVDRRNGGFLEAPELAEGEGVHEEKVDDVRRERDLAGEIEGLDSSSVSVALGAAQGRFLRRRGLIVRTGSQVGWIYDANTESPVPETG